MFPLLQSLFWFLWGGGGGGGGGGVARGVVSVLKSLCRFKMCADIKNCLFVKSIALEDSCFQEINFLVKRFLP